MQTNRCKRLLTWLLSSLLVTQLMGFADPGCVGTADTTQQNPHSATDNQLTVADMAGSDHAHHQLGHGDHGDHTASLNPAPSDSTADYSRHHGGDSEQNCCEGTSAHFCAMAFCVVALPAPQLFADSHPGSVAVASGVSRFSSVQPPALQRPPISLA